MSKKSTPLEALRNLTQIAYENKYDIDDKIEKYFEIIETALKRLKEQDEIFKKYDINSNWLEACLYIIKKHFPMDTEIQLKKLIALDIIKEKTLTINDLYWLKNGNYRGYRKGLEELYSGIEEEHLQKILKTQQEFDLLKEVLL